jgi:EAL domain-containing protein (putative c-di-GMP-specific phosphodiesterase class I)
MRLLKEYSPKLIFMEVALGQSDVIEAIRGLAAQKYDGAVQLFSAKEDALLNEISAIGRKYKLNMLPIIRKPCSAQVLDDIARKYLARRGVSAAPTQAQRSVDLGMALQRGWIEAWYQPKIDLRGRRMIGVEALVRLNHPEHGIMSPASFLPQAKAPVLHKLTEHMIGAALRDWGRMERAGFPVKIAVNASIDCLLNVPIAEIIRENQPSTSNWPGLMLEITEEQVIRDQELFHEIATQLRIYNVSFSVDDFGSGYSSFTRLKQFVFSELKLDGSFVRGCAQDKQNAAICQAAIDLAHNYDAVAVAECVDNTGDLIALHQLGCDVAQGYLLCRPVPIEKLISMLKLKVNEQRRPTIDLQPASTRTSDALQSHA